MKLSETHLLLAVCLLFALSSVFLFWKNQAELNPNQGKNWWTLSFTEPENLQSIDFTIENHADTSTFHYQILSGREVLSEQDVEITKGETKKIDSTIVPQENVRTTVRVMTGTEKKEIYR